MYDKIAKAYINKSENLSESLNTTVYHHDADEIRDGLDDALHQAHELNKHLATNDTSIPLNNTMSTASSGRLDIVANHRIPGNYYVGDMVFDKAILVGSNTKAGSKVKKDFVDFASENLGRNDLHFDEHKTIVTPTHTFMLNHKYGSNYSTIGIRQKVNEGEGAYFNSRNPNLNSSQLRDVFGSVEGYGLKDKDVGMNYVNHPSANKDVLFDVAEKHEHPEVRKAALNKLRNM